jgi:hypothetical protein
MESKFGPWSLEDDNIGQELLTSDFNLPKKKKEGMIFSHVLV